MRIFLLGLVWLPVSYKNFATPVSGPKWVHFYGHVTTAQQMVRLQFYVLPHHLFALNDSGTTIVDVPVDARGQFSIAIPASEPGRITLLDKVTSSNLFYAQFFEPGDSISIDAKVVVDSNGSQFIADFSGIGAEKYRCVEALGLSSDIDFQERITLYNKRNKGRMYEVADSIISAQIGVLDRFKRRVSPRFYDVMKADILGGVYGKLEWGLFGSVRKDFYRKRYDDTTLQAMRTKLARFLDYSRVKVPEESLAMSEFYVEFTYASARVELAYENPVSPFSLSDLCARLQKDAQGDLKSVCLAYALLEDENVITEVDTTVSCEEYTDCLEKARMGAGMAWAKAALSDVLRTRGKGAVAFNFCLPADSTGCLVRLSDFRGKVVLLDMWAYECTGCTLFTQAFHQEVYPMFKDNPDFKVVSVIISPTPKDKYMVRLRSTEDPRFGKRLSVYTYPDYVNLFGGKGVAMGEAMSGHYHINSYPTIFLIDKQGRIFSSTVPFFTDPRSENVAKLTGLIRQALEDK
jgi:peroxiredoxin